MHEDFGKPTILGNLLRKLQRAIIRRGRGRGDIIHDTWGSVKGRKDGAEASCSPHSSASTAVSMRAVNTRSLALDKPNSRTARCVPPAPGMIPRRTSGRPILVTSCATTLSVRHLTPVCGSAYQPRASRKQSRARGHRPVRDRLLRRWLAWAGIRVPTMRNGYRGGTCRLG